MPATIPNLTLTHGQLLWAISLGQDPTAEVKDKVRYLRQLGIPRPTAERAGRGHHIAYGFDDLALVGFGLLGLSEGFKPRALVNYLVDLRDEFLRLIHHVWTELPGDLLEQSWVKARGREMIMREAPWYLSLHGRGRGELAGIELVQGEGSATSPHLVPYEILPGEAPAKVFEIDYWLPQWTAWAIEASTPRRGREPLSKTI